MTKAKLSEPVSDNELQRIKRGYQALYGSEVVSKAFDELKRHTTNVQVGHVILMGRFLNNQLDTPITMWRKDFCSEPLEAEGT